jgi:hypothetical protein
MAAIPAFATVAETGQRSPEATAHVLDFLHRHPVVSRLLEKAEGPLRVAFGPDVTLTLAVETDPEIPSWEGSDIRVMLAHSFRAMVTQIVDSTPGAHHGYDHPRCLSTLYVPHV